jgi:hypothetical protein
LEEGREEDERWKMSRKTGCAFGVEDGKWRSRNSEDRRKNLVTEVTQKYFY